MIIEEWEILSQLPNEEIERLSRIKAAGGRVNELIYKMELDKHKNAQLSDTQIAERYKNMYEHLLKQISKIEESLV